MVLWAHLCQRRRLPGCRQIEYKARRKPSGFQGLDRDSLSLVLRGLHHRRGGLGRGARSGASGALPRFDALRPRSSRRPARAGADRPDEPQDRLPRLLPDTPAARPEERAPPAARPRRLRGRQHPRHRQLLRLRRDLQPRVAGSGRPAGGVEAGRDRQDRLHRGRVGQSRVSRAHRHCGAQARHETASGACAGAGCGAPRIAPTGHTGESVDPGAATHQPLDALTRDMAILETINSPADLRQLDQSQLAQLAGEVRAFLVEQTSRTGGHLSPNLGVVELTFALHRVFDSPKDAIVWDTGHQAYVHKIVTGRARDFERLRQAGGLSGYPSRKESEHDLVENSHASTSLSYALGIAEARLRKGTNGYVVAVIGDGALTGGMAYEALNQIAHLQPPNLIIVINDNGRSYAPTVGGLARHLSQLPIDPRYERVKVELSHRLRELPLVGYKADQAAFRVKESLKQLLQPNTVFDSLGLKYAGACDGHDLEALEELLARARRLQAPSVIHVVTEKGRGYEPAIEDEIDKLHGVSAFDPLTGRPRQ